MNRPSVVLAEDLAPLFLDYLRASPDDWYGLVERLNRNTEPLVCGCQPSPEDRAHWSIQLRDGEFVPVHFKYHRKRHSTDCEFSSSTGGPQLPRARAGSYLPAIERVGGRLNISLGAAFASIFAPLPLGGTTADPKAAFPSSSSSPGSGTHKHRLGLRALLTHLADEAKLTHWSPSIGAYRDVGTCLGALFGAASRICLEGDLSLSAVLHGGHQVSRKTTAQLLATPSPAVRGNSRMFLGFVERVDSAPAGKSLVVHADGSSLFVPSKVWETAALSNQQHFSLADDGTPTRATLALCVAEFLDAKWTCHDFVFMRFSRYLVAVDSEPEARAADRLCESKRRFRKVVGTPVGLNFEPDFELLDTVRRVVVEVAGRERDPDYLKHLAKKTAHYESREVALVTWFPSQPFPDELPPSVEFHLTRAYQHKLAE